MTALAKDTDIRGKNVSSFISYLVAATQTIYKGALVSVKPASGLLVVGANTTSDICVGVADEAVTSTTAGVKTCKVRSGGLFYLTTDTQAQTDTGSTVYVNDSGQVSTTTGNAVKAGRLVIWVDATHSWIWIPPFGAAAY